MPAWGVEGPYKGYTGLGSGIEGTTGHAAVRGLKEKDMIHLPGNFMTDATAHAGDAPLAQEAAPDWPRSEGPLKCSFRQAGWQLPQPSKQIEIPKKITPHPTEQNPPPTESFN